jgi:hypothetical protein
VLLSVEDIFDALNLYQMLNVLDHKQIEGSEDGSGSDEPEGIPFYGGIKYIRLLCGYHKYLDHLHSDSQSISARASSKNPNPEPPNLFCKKPVEDENYILVDLSNLEICSHHNSILLFGFLVQSSFSLYIYSNKSTGYLRIFYNFQNLYVNQLTGCVIFFDRRFVPKGSV